MGALLKKLILLLALAGLAGAALAQSVYPNKPVRVIVGFPPGGSNDIIARLVSAKLQEALAQPIIVENKLGADGIIATEFAAKSTPDGYTLAVGSTGQMIVNMVVYSKVPFDPVRDFAPITLMGYFPIVLAVHPSFPAKTVRELIALAKSRPGQFNYGTGGSTFHLTMEMFNQAAGIDVRHIPYKGSAMTVNAAVANDVQMLFIDATAVLASLKGGKLRGLAVAAKERTPLLPDLPTIAESGLPGFNMAGWLGLFAPAGTPADVVSKLNREVVRIVNLADIREKMVNLGIDSGGNTPGEFAAIIKLDLERWGAAARAGNIKVK